MRSRLTPKKHPSPTTDAITDAEIKALRQTLLAGPTDDRQLHGLVACHDALGRSHRRNKARSLCVDLIRERVR